MSTEEPRNMPPISPHIRSRKKKSSSRLNQWLLPGERRSDFQILFDAEQRVMPRGPIEESCAALQFILHDLLRKKKTQLCNVVAEKLALNRKRGGRLVAYSGSSVSPNPSSMPRLFAEPCATSRASTRCS